MFLSEIEEGTSIFIDANIFIYHFSKESRFNQACSNFLEYIETKSIAGFTSLSVVQEVTHRMMIIEAAALHPEIKVKDMVKYLKANPKEVKKLIKHQDIPLEIDSLNLFGLYSPPLTASSSFRRKPESRESNTPLLAAG